MFFTRLKTPGLAHIAYVIADDGEAAVIDPARDIERILAVLTANGLRLRYVLETHRQEDFEMGGAELRRLTGAHIAAFAHPVMGHADLRLDDGATLSLGGGLTIQALHVPGHTPESTCFAVTAADAPTAVWGVFTGDALFIGDTGRTDLTNHDLTASNAGQLYDALHAKVFPLGDQALVFPAHGAGSACGGAVFDRDQSTLGLERTSNAAAVLSRADFIARKTSEKLGRPPYFRWMEKVNLEAGRAMPDAPLPWLSPRDFDHERHAAVVLDTRDVEAFAGGHVPQAYSLWQGGVAPYAGWIADHDTPLLLIAHSPQAAVDARDALARIGSDHVIGALAGGFEAWRDAGLPMATSAPLTPARLHAQRQDWMVLDVRETHEYATGHIPGARHALVGTLEERLDSLHLPQGAPIAVTCSVGHRASLATSILLRHGVSQAATLLGGMTAWSALGLPTTAG